MQRVIQFVQDNQDTLTTSTVQAIAKDFGLDFDALVAVID